MNDFEHGDTLVETLRRANPVGVEQVTDRRSLPSAHALFDEIVSQPTRRVRRRQVVVIAIAIIVILASLVAFAAVQRDHANPALPALCYEKADLGSRRVVVGSGGNPAQACAGVWAEAFGGASVPSHFDACVLPTGVPAVFPGESGTVCGSLGLKELTTSNYEKRIEDFAAEAGAMVSDHCIDDAEARAIVSRELEKFGLGDWTIGHNGPPFSHENPCASLAVVPEQRVVLIVPIGIVHPGDSIPKSESGAAQ